ncbi:MAG: ribonuclease [Verrucomicrobia bacterium]|nr:ribonuclease [Verrucomicrobiota bacterium]
MARTVKRGHRLRHLFRTEIWDPAYIKQRSLRGYSYAVLRVISITFTVFNETRAASRAAALSFSSLLGIGPLIGVAVLVGGFMLGQNSDPTVLANRVAILIKRVAPQLQQLESMNPVNPGGPNAELADLIKGMIAGSRSSTGGALGAFTLIIIVLLLFKTIEDTFNEIWGVRAGRSVAMRIVLYWTVLTLGAVLFFASLTLLGAGAFVNVFLERLPFGKELLGGLRWLLPLFSATVVVCLLTLFYRFTPNTRVYWRAALTGAIVVAALLLLNNFLAFLYLKRVYLEKSLYGSLGILPILMLGLYVFWLFVLIGGQISYAVQNAHFRNSQAAWGHLSESMRERLSLIVLLTICRRFRSCLPAVTASHLGDLLRVPTQILNECLNRLVDMKLLTPIPPPAGQAPTDYFYQPARPLSHITLQQFKRLDDNLGDDPVGQTLEQIDPVLQHYTSALNQLLEQDFLKKSFEELLAEFEFDGSRPPFAMGHSQPGPAAT